MEEQIKELTDRVKMLELKLEQAIKIINNVNVIKMCEILKEQY